MTTFLSPVITIPGMALADAVTGITVAKKTGVAWSDNNSLWLNADTGEWELADNPTLSVSPVWANGAAASGAATGSVKLMPYIPIGQVGADRLMLTNSRTFRASGMLTPNIVNGATSYAIPVVAVASETWIQGSNIYRVDLASSSDFRKYSNVNAGTNTIVGTAARAKTAGDADGFVVITALIDVDVDGSGASNYRAQITEVVKPSGETWSAGGVVFTDGVTYSINPTSGTWWRVGYVVPPGAAGTTRGWMSTENQVQTDLALVEHLMRGDYFFLIPDGITPNQQTIYQDIYDNGFGGPTSDIYRLQFQPYKLILAASMRIGGTASNTNTDAIFPSMAFDVDASTLFNLASGGDHVVVWEGTSFASSGLSVVGSIYAKSLVGTVATGLPVPPFCVDEGSGAIRAPMGGAWEQMGHYTQTGGGTNRLTATRLGLGCSVDFYTCDSNGVDRGGSSQIEQLVVDQSIVGANKSKYIVVGGGAMGVIFTDAFSGGRTRKGTTSLTGDPWLLMSSFRFTTSVNGGASYGQVSYGAPSAGGQGSYVLTNFGAFPYEYDIPRWHSEIPGHSPASILTSLEYKGYGYAPPAPVPLVWAGGYSAALSVLSGNLYTVTITATRNSTPDVTDTERYTKVTTWSYAVIHPNGQWMADFTNARFRKKPVRSTAFSTTGITTDSWSDRNGFTATLKLPRNLSGASIDYVIIIEARTSCASVYRETNIFETDVQRLTVTVPSA